MKKKNFQQQQTIHLFAKLKNQKKKKTAKQVLLKQKKVARSGKNSF